MRTGKSEKSAISAADMTAAVDDELPPLIMPHLEYDQSSLDALYPSLSVAEAVDADDPLNDEEDPLLLEGQRRAQALVDACEEQGRRRRLVEPEEPVAVVGETSGTLTPELHVVTEPPHLSMVAELATCVSIRRLDYLGRGQMSPLVSLASNRFAARSNGLENDSARPELRAAPGRV